MNSLERALIEKAGNNHGFEYVLPGEDQAVKLASARHRAQVRIAPLAGRFLLTFASPAADLLNAELMRGFPALAGGKAGFVATTQDEVARLLRRAAELAHALPNQAALDFEATLDAELARLPGELRGTEVERWVRQRLGQQAFRGAMLDYWGNACAVTGIAIPEVLRASHAKPWADCASDAERLDVFNGFLLSANLDALFDRFLVSFDDAGELLIAPRISPPARALLGLNQPRRLRWLAREHLPYLRFHREKFAAGASG